MPEGYEAVWDTYGEGLYLKFEGKPIATFSTRQEAKIYALAHDTNRRLTIIEESLARIDRMLTE